MLELGIRRERHVELTNHRRDIFVGQSAGKNNMFPQAFPLKTSLQLRAQRAIAHHHQLKFFVLPHKLLEQSGQNLDAMPRSKAADEPQDRAVIQSQTRANRRLRRARPEKSRVHAVREHLHTPRFDTE